MRPAWRALGLAAVVAIGGCKTMVERERGDEAAWGARQQQLAGLDDWRVEGRVAIDADGDGYSGSLSWDQQGQALDFQFKGPFGFGGLRIHGDADALEVRTHKGDSFTVTDPERDFEERLGWSLPIRSMRYWMAGVPAPEAPNQAEVDARGRPVRLVQQGWQVDYQDYQTVAGLELPRRMSIAREGVKIKLVAERWQLRSQAPAAAPASTPASAPASTPATAPIRVPSSPTDGGFDDLDL